MPTHRTTLWTEAGVEVREAPRPAAGPVELLIAVRACGICGSDLHVYRGETPRPAGVGPGHGVVGEVAALGEGVAGPAVGTRVALEPYTSCGACRHCLRGRGYLCARRRLLGFGLPGGMAEHVVVPAGRAFPLPEPAAIALHGLRRAGLEVGQRVFVIGAGAIGLLATLLARAGGATRVGV